MATANAQDSSETPELSSPSSDKESSRHVDSPSVASNDEDTSISEMPSSAASSKGESSLLVESPPGTSKDGEDRDVPEMSSLASSKEESSTPVELPPRTSKKDRDEIDILSSNTQSPSLFSSVHSTFREISECSNDSCSWISKLDCVKNKRASIYNFLLFVIGFLAFILSCTLKLEDESPIWELVYFSSLLIYCSLLTCCKGRGCYSESPCLKRDPSRRGCCSGGGCVEIISPVFGQRKKTFARVSEGESSKDEVLAVIQEDSAEYESNDGMDRAGQPGDPSVRVEIAFVD